MGMNSLHLTSSWILENFRMAVIIVCCRVLQLFMQVYSWLNPRKSYIVCCYCKLLLGEQERVMAIISNKYLEEIINKERQRIKMYGEKKKIKERGLSNTSLHSLISICISYLKVRFCGLSLHHSSSAIKYDKEGILKIFPWTVMQADIFYEMKDQCT